MNFTTLRVPNEIWKRCQEHAKTLGKSANSTAVECIAGCLDEMDKKEPEIPKVVKLFHFLKKK